jgi:hypothetical protein
MKAHRTPKQGVVKKAISRLDKEIDSARRLESYRRDIKNGLDSISETVVSIERRSKRSVRKDVTSSVALVKQLSSNMFRSLKDISPNVVGVMSASWRVQRAQRERDQIAGVDTPPNVGMKRVHEVISMQKENVWARVRINRRESPPDRLVVGVSSPLLLSSPAQIVLKTPPANGRHYMLAEVVKLFEGMSTKDRGPLQHHMIEKNLIPIKSTRCIRILQCRPDRIPICWGKVGRPKI